MNHMNALRPANAGKNVVRRLFERRVAAVALGAAVIVVAGGTGAVGASLITSADIADGSIRGVDIAGGAVGSESIRDNSVTSADLSGTAAQLTSLTAVPGSNWGIVDRKVFKNGDAYLRTGPTFATANDGTVSPPLGDGSLGLRTGSTDDQTAFGNQVGFFGDLVSGLTTLGFSVFTTSENNGRGPRNMPSIVIEIDPNLAGVGRNTSSMVYTPRNGTADRWTAFDATDNTQGRVWGLTGAAGNATGCAFSGAQCTWDRIQEVLEDGDGNPATIRSILIAKLRGNAFSGAVDALRVRGNTYDFEPLGVTVTP
jgi:hypothetical protein